MANVHSKQAIKPGSLNPKTIFFLLHCTNILFSHLNKSMVKTVLASLLLILRWFQNCLTHKHTYLHKTLNWKYKVLRKDILLSLNSPCDSLDFVLADWSMCLVNSVYCLSSLTPLSPCLPFDSLDKIQSLQDSKLDNPLRHLVICSTGFVFFFLCQLLSTLGTVICFWHSRRCP